MEEIIINYNICDSAPECGGISCCHTNAIIYNEKSKRPEWLREKCDFCLECTTREACPVGAILYARDDKESNRIHELIEKSPVTNQVLWSERYGVQPATFQQKAKVITTRNVNQFVSDLGLKVIDFWHPDSLDCRLKSPLYSDLFFEIEKLDDTKNSSKKAGANFYRIEGGKLLEVQEKLKISTYPTLLILINNIEVYRHEGLIPKKQIPEIRKQISLAI